MGFTPLYSRPSHTRTMALRRPVLRPNPRSWLSGPRRNNRRRHMPLPDYSMRQLLEAGVHFGHQAHRWNPKMSEYIFGVRNNIHILDLAQTVPMMHRALQAVSDTVAKGGRILFVGTKRQAQDAIADAAKRSAQYYVNSRRPRLTASGADRAIWASISVRLKSRSSRSFRPNSQRADFSRWPVRAASLMI